MNLQSFIGAVGWPAFIFMILSSIAWTLGFMSFLENRKRAK